MTVSPIARHAPGSPEIVHGIDRRADQIGSHPLAHLVERVDDEDESPEPSGTFLDLGSFDQLDEVCERMGTDLIGTPIDAVQPGRRIATVREEAGLGLPLALMTPDLR